MEYCYRCEVSDSKALLFDVVRLTGIDKICRKCSFEENLPIVKKSNIVEKDEMQTVYERLSRMSGFADRKKKKNEEQKKEEVRLKEIVNRNFRRTVGTTDFRDKLIDNFHWIVMRARRSKHLMQKEMADKIKESEVSLRMFERGIVNDIDLVKKVENFLSIRLRKDVEKPMEDMEYPKFETEKEIANFDKDKFRGLTIEDLKEMKEEKERGIFDESDWTYASSKKEEKTRDSEYTSPKKEEEEEVGKPDSGDFELLEDSK